MAEQFKFKLGDEVDIAGGVKGAVVIARLIWETLQHPEPTNYYEIRTGDKTLSVSEAELSSHFTSE